MGATTSAPAAASNSSRVLNTPYTPPRDVLVWNRLQRNWLRVDIGNELDPTVEWLQAAIELQLGQCARSTSLFLGRNDKPLSSVDRQRPIDYYTSGQLSGCTAPLPSK